MHIASENSEADLARQRASDQVRWRVRELTANLLRITRGAGKPYDVLGQMSDLAEAMQGYQATTGLSSCPDEFVRALNVSNDLETTLQWSAEDRYRDDAEGLIIRGVLQVVASRLVGQKTQEAAGRSEMAFGLRELDELRAEVRKARAQAARDARPAAPDANAAKTRPTKPKARVGRPRLR
jgi:hypothetical protein